jgi:hypothetical protein
LHAANEAGRKGRQHPKRRGVLSEQHHIDGKAGNGPDSRLSSNLWSVSKPCYPLNVSKKKQETPRALTRAWGKFLLTLMARLGTDQTPASHLILWSVPKLLSQKNKKTEKTPPGDSELGILR